MEELIRVVKPWETEFRITKDSQSKWETQQSAQLSSQSVTRDTSTWHVLIFSVSVTIELNYSDFFLLHTMFRFVIIQTCLPRSNSTKWSFWILQVIIGLYKQIYPPFIFTSCIRALLSILSTFSSYS